MRNRLVLFALILSVVNLLLAACGRTTTTSTGLQLAIPTRTADTASPTPGVTQPPGTHNPTPTQVALHIPCDSSVPGMRSGDLLIYSSYVGWQSYPAAFAGLAYPRRHIPDGTPLKPLQIQFGQSSSGTALSLDPPTNPVMHEHAGGYAFAVCNLSSTQSHTVQSVSVQIATVTSYASTLSEWDWCYGPFDAQSRRGGGGGCGGAYWAGEYLHATFAANATTGATVAVTQVGSGRDDGLDGYPFGPLPVPLKPAVAIPINVGMTVPTTPGTYTFAFQIVVDGATINASAPPTLFAPAAHEWTGDACTSSTMESQISQASSPTYYLCPAS